MTSGHEGQRYIRKVIVGSAVTGWIVIVVMMIWVTGDVIAQIFGSSLPDTVNWVEILNVIGFTLPLAYVTMKKSHITVELFTAHGRIKRLRDIFALILTFLFTGLVAWQLSGLAWRSTLMLESQNLTMRVYWFPAKIALALGFLGSAVIMLVHLIAALRGKKEEQGTGPVENEA
jgi:TRAP-type mannitol/chloroaromatic compound transport system permease small subunit